MQEHWSDQRGANRAGKGQVDEECMSVGLRRKERCLA